MVGRENPRLRNMDELCCAVTSEYFFAGFGLTLLTK